ncbi:MAG: MarR family transcriptional regulator [Clostridia bacterium]|nr:MarR family transcriptional regulator [Clostridia bacterium]
MQRKNDIGLAIRKLSILIKRDIEKSKIKLGIDTLKGVNGWAINYFNENRDKNIFQKDFEEKFSIRRSTASNILKNMEQKGLIKRIAVENDARLKKIVLTAAAIDLNNKINEDIKLREIKMRKDIDQKELEIFFKVIDKISDNLEVQND